MSSLKPLPSSSSPSVNAISTSWGSSRSAGPTPRAGRGRPGGGVDLDPRIAGVVGDVEDAVAVGVVGVGQPAQVSPPGSGSSGVRAGVVGHLGLAPGDPGLAAQVDHRGPVVPLDPRVEHGDRHVGASGRGLPSGLRRVLGVGEVRATHAAELERAVVVLHDQGVGRRSGVRRSGRVHPLELVRSGRLASGRRPGTGCSRPGHPGRLDTGTPPAPAPEGDRRHREDREQGPRGSAHPALRGGLGAAHCAVACTGGPTTAEAAPLKLPYPSLAQPLPT